MLLFVVPDWDLWSPTGTSATTCATSLLHPYHKGFVVKQACFRWLSFLLFFFNFSFPFVFLIFLLFLFSQLADPFHIPTCSIWNFPG